MAVITYFNSGRRRVVGVLPMPVWNEARSRHALRCLR